MNLPKISKLPSVSKITSLLPKKDPEVPTYVLVDAGSSAVQAAVCRIEDEQVHFLGKGRVLQEEGAMFGGMIGHLDSFMEAMSKAMQQAFDAAGTTGDQLVLGLSGSLVGGVTTMVHLGRSEPKEKMQDKELRSIMERICQSALQDAEAQVSDEMGIEKDDLRLINSAITSISMDGYPLASPLGFSGKEMDVCLFNAFTSSSTLVALQKMLTELNVDLSILASEPYALAQAVVAMDKKPKHAEAVIIDVGAGTTSVTLVQDGAVVGNKDLIIGGRAVTAAIAEELGLSTEEAEAAKLDYASGKASETTKKRLEPVVAEVTRIWQRGISLALADLASERALPGRICLTGGGSLIPDIEEALAKAEWREGLFLAKPKVERLSIEGLPRIEGKDVLEATDVPLASLGLLLEERQSEDEHVAHLFQQTLKALT